MALFRRIKLTILVLLALSLIYMCAICNTTKYVQPTKRLESEHKIEKIQKCPVEFRVRSYDYDFHQIGQDPPLNNRTDHNIIILTPFSDSVAKLTTYFQLLCALTYPHEQISIGLGIDSGFDTTQLREVTELVNRFTLSFRNITIHILTQKKAPWAHNERHEPALQKVRRKHLAAGRNELLFQGIQKEHDWVIWLDADMAYFSPDFVQLLLSPNEPIVSPACVRHRPFNTYDLNVWRETPESRAYIAQQKALNGDDFLMIEEVQSTKRIRLVDLKDEGKVVPIDGVGGCALLVKASCHREGLIFPSFVFESQIETEGLAKMAAKMGFPIYGLPFVQVFHMTDDP